MESPYEEDADVTDWLESRYFYELMQAYRWQPIDAAKSFEDVKNFIRDQMAYHHD